MRALNRPTSWWGWHGWNHPQPMSLIEIIRDGTLPEELAAVFWLGIERGASFIFAADPAGAGKTTLLTSLLPFAHPDAGAYFTRGWGETFDLPPRPEGPGPVFLMVNEMSDHLPVYSWGPYVVRAFELLAQGYGLLTTMHADDCEEALAQLEQDNGVPRQHIAHLTFIVPLAVRYGGPGRGTLRRVSEVGLVGPDATDGYTLRRIVRWDSERDGFHLFEGEGDCAAVAERLHMTDEAFDRAVAERTDFLRGLVQAGIAEADEVEARVEAWRRARP